MSSSEIVPISQKIDRLMKRIEDGDIKIPAFQRGYVWKQEQVIDLLDSIRLDYPIGSVLLWNSNEHLQSTRNIAGFPLPTREENYPVNYVLDGQQRLSSIYAVFSGHKVQEKATQDYNPNTKIFDIYYNFEFDSFITSEQVASLTNKSSVICLRNYLDTTTFLDQLQELDSKYHLKAKELYSKFSNYEVPVVTVRNKRKEEVGIIFERINNTGTRMNIVDIMVAWTWSDDFHLKEAISKLSETLNSKGFGDVPTKVVLQAIGGITRDTTKTKEILDLDPEVIRSNFDLLSASLIKSIDFLFTEFNCSNSDFLPHVQQIIGLSKFYSLAPSPANPEQLDKVKAWFWATAFSRRYAGQTDDKMDADIAFMKSLVKGHDVSEHRYIHSIDPKTLISTPFSKGHPYVRGFLLLMAANNPLDLAKGIKVDTGLSLSEFNRKEYHHVFPQAFLKNRGLPTEKINSLMNFCFLPADSNKKISNKPPSDYFTSIVPQDRYQDVLKSNFLPISREIYRTDDYDQFLHARATLVVQKIDELTSK